MDNCKKIQKEETQVYITDMDMLSGFDLIIRKDLIEVLENILPQDEVRMVSPHHQQHKD